MAKGDNAQALEVQRKAAGETEFKKVSIDKKGREIKPGIEEAVTAEEVIPEVEDSQIEQIGLQGVEIFKKEDLPRMPETDDEKKVWAEWSNKLDQAMKDIYEAPTQKEINIEDVPTVKEGAYGEQKVQAAPALETDEMELTEADLEKFDPTELVLVPDLPEYDEKTGNFTETEFTRRADVQRTLPDSSQEGEGVVEIDEPTPKEIRGEEEYVDVQGLIEGGLAVSKKEAKLPAPNVPKAEYDDIEPPTLEELAKMVEDERISSEDTGSLEKKVNDVSRDQFMKEKQVAHDAENRLVKVVNNVGSIAGELGYTAEQLRQTPGLEKASANMAKILASARNLAETSLSGIAGSVMGTGKELKTFFTLSKKERGVRSKYKKELKGVEKKIGKTKDEEELGRLTELRNILTAALM
ncbi:MAG: hypothetical protein WC663_04220 [Patescibacteria group bacterium]|jgi:hypothetical protein